MVELQKSLAKITATRTLLVGVSYDSTEVLKKFTDTSGVKFPLLADPGSRTIKAYGIHNRKGLPHPGTYLIGKDRKVLAELFIEGYRDRHKPEALLKVIREAAR